MHQHVTTCWLTYCVSDVCCPLKLRGGPMDASLLKDTQLGTGPGSGPGESGVDCSSGLQNNTHRFECECLKRWRDVNRSQSHLWALVWLSWSPHGVVLEGGTPSPLSSHWFIAETTFTQTTTCWETCITTSQVLITAITCRKCSQLSNCTIQLQ